jgi:hypothetical protein
MRIMLIAGAALALGGCAATHYDLTVMPRDSGKLYQGVAEDHGGQGPISITIEGKAYNGSWVQVEPERSYGYVSGGWGYGGWGHHGGWGVGGSISMDNPQGGASKALLNAADGSGMRCDFRQGQGLGGGLCRDDRGREYDVQFRAVASR